jgi:hypothetical protein
MRKIGIQDTRLVIPGAGITGIFHQPTVYSSFFP